MCRAGRRSSDDLDVLEHADAAAASGSARLLPVPVPVPAEFDHQILQQALGGDAGGKRLDVRLGMRGLAGVLGRFFSLLSGMNSVVPNSMVVL